MIIYGSINDKTISFRKFRIYPLIKEDLANYKYNNSTLQALLNYRFFKRLSQWGIKLKLVVDWFENQPIDKGFNLGVNTFFPGTEHIGYKGFIISEDFNFYLRPSEFEIQKGVIPREINVVGRGLIESNTKYCNDIKVNIAPAYRFVGLWKTKKPELINKSKKSILVALPIAFKESLEIVKIIFDANHSIGNLDFNFKPHPALDFNLVKQPFQNDWPDNFKCVGGDFTARLLESNLLLGNTSSTCMEALAMGIPVIIIGSQSNLTQNPIPDTVTNEIWKIIYTAEDLSKYIYEFLNLNQNKIDEIKLIGENIKVDFFEPVTRENTRQFLKLH